MGTVYLLEGEFGEYEQRVQQVYGVFFTKEEAIEAASKLPKESNRLYRLYKDFEKKCHDLATESGFPNPKTYILNQSEEEMTAWHAHTKKYSEFKEELGPEPDFFANPESWWVTELKVGELGIGDIVFRSDRD